MAPESAGCGEESQGLVVERMGFNSSLSHVLGFPYLLSEDNIPYILWIAGNTEFLVSVKCSHLVNSQKILLVCCFGNTDTLLSLCALYICLKSRLFLLQLLKCQSDDIYTQDSIPWQPAYGGCLWNKLLDFKVLFSLRCQ